MENSRISATILLVLVFLEIGVAEIVTKPSTTEVVVNGSTYLNCSTNIHKEIHWFHTPVGSNRDRSFVFGYSQFYAPYNGGRFGIERNQANGAYNLIIPSVKVEDAGQYDCQDQNGQGKKASAQLTVLETDPICEPRSETHEIIGPNKCGIEPNQVILSCIVKYHGNEAPILEWRKTSDNTLVIEGVTHEAIDNIRVVYNLTIKGNSTVKDGDSYFCSTTRSTMSNYVCTSCKMKIKGSEPAEVPEPSDGNDIIKPYKIAIICICIFLLLPLFIAVVVLSWKLRYIGKHSGIGYGRPPPYTP